MKNDLRKPNIERLLTTMKGGIADRVPNYEILLEARNVKALLGRDVIRDYVKVARANNLGVAYCMGAIFQTSYFFLCDFNEFLLKFHTDRRFVETLFDMCTDYYLEISRIAIEEGIDILFLADDAVTDSEFRI